MVIFLILQKKKKKGNYRFREVKILYNITQLLCGKLRFKSMNN